LRILSFDPELIATVAEAEDFTRKLADEGKIGQGRLTARKR
jgi:hypothetical protein